MSQSSLYPIRIDVSSSDKTVRVVDTLLIDPTCWPIPLYAPLQESVERNIREYAHSVLSDAEVLGMGRTVRHFSGRVDLWTPALQAKIEDQLRPQIWAIVNNDITTRSDRSEKSKSSATSSLIPISIQLLLNGIKIHEDIYWDPQVPVSPMEFAREMAHDMNLSEEATIAITISILEQLYGLEMDVSKDEWSLLSSATTTTTSNSNSNSNSNSADMSKRGAWMLDHKESLATTNQIIAQHRPV